MNYTESLAKLKSINNSEKEIRKSISNLTSKIGELKKPQIPSPKEIALKEFESNIANKGLELEEGIKESLKEISTLKLREQMLRNTDPKVDESVYINQVKAELAKVSELQVEFDKVANHFDNLFNSPKARDLLEEHLSANSSVTSLASLDELLKLSDNITSVEKALSRVKNVHSDSYSVAMHYLFPRLGEIFKDIDKRQLLFIYVLYYLVILVLLLYYPLYTALPITIVILITCIVNFSKYDSIIKSFSKAYTVLNLAQNAEKIIAENIAKKVLEKKGEIKKENAKRSDEILKDIEKMKLQVDKEKKEINVALEKYKKEQTMVLNKNLASIENEQKELIKQVHELEENVKEKEKELEALEKEKRDLYNSLEVISGIKEPLENLKEILDPLLLLGYDDKTSEPIFLDISEPTYLEVESVPLKDVLDIMLVQLMNRMDPTKIKIYIYDEDNMGMDFVTYTSQEYSDYGVNILSSKTEWNEFLKDLDKDLLTFRLSLSDFGDIHKFNEYMSKADSVTRKYILIILLSPPSSLNFKGYKESLGVHWVSTTMPTKEDEKNRFLDIFRNRVTV